MSNVLALIFRLAFIVFNACVFVIIIGPLVIYLAEKYGASELSEAIKNADIVGMALIGSFVALWGHGFYCVWRTRMERSRWENRKLWTSLVVYSFVAAYLFFVRRAKLFPTLWSSEKRP